MTFLAFLPKGWRESFLQGLQKLLQETAAIFE